MDIALLAGRLLLSVIFALAAVTKLWDRRGTAQAVRDFGVWKAASGPVAAVLPVAELAVAIALLPASSGRLAGAGAAALLATFTAAIVSSLVRGRRPDCHCFGRVHAAPIGAWTLVRNGGLLAAAVAISIWGPGAAIPSVLRTVTPTTAVLASAGVVLAVVLGVQMRVLLHLLRQNGRLLLRIEALEARAGSGHRPVEEPQPGLPVGAVAPDFTLPGLYGETNTLQSLLARGIPAVLVFADPDCVPCAALVPDIGRWQREHAGALTVSVVSRGAVAANADSRV